MMKQILLVAVLIFTIGFKGYSQCTPSWPSGGGTGISPDSATNLPHGVEGMAYNTTIQFKAPLDTLYLGFPVIIDNITIDNVTGLSTIPNISPFTYTTNPSGGIFPGGSVGCINITGTPSIGSNGTYNLGVDVTATAHFQGSSLPITQSYTIDFYKIVVDANTSVPVINKGKFDLTQNFPNPFSTKTNIAFNLPSPSQVTFKVYDLVGNTLNEKIIDGKSGINTIDFDGSNLAEGVYFYSISNGTGVLTRRLIIDRK